MRWMKVGPACEYLGGISAKTLYAAVRVENSKPGLGCKAARIGAGRNLLFADAWLDAYATRCSERPGAVVLQPKKAQHGDPVRRRA